MARLVGDGDGSFSRWRVVVDHVDLRIAVGVFHDLFRTVIFSENLRVHQHTTISRAVEPAEIQDRFRLAGTEEIPFAIDPSLDPGVVIVRMRPARRVDLPGRNAHRAEGGNRKGRFLAATAISGLDRGERRAGAGVRRGVDHFLVAPMVDLEHGVIKREPFHPVFQLLIENHAALVKILVVDPDREHEVAEDHLGDAVAPRHRLACLESGAYITEVEITAVIRNVSDGHVGVKECHGLLFLRRHRLVEHFEKVAVWQGSLFRLEIFLDLGAISVVGNEMLGFVIARGSNQENE